MKIRAKLWFLDEQEYKEFNLGKVCVEVNMMDEKEVLFTYKKLHNLVLFSDLQRRAEFLGNAIEQKS